MCKKCDRRNALIDLYTVETTADGASVVDLGALSRDLTILAFDESMSEEEFISLMRSGFRQTLLLITGSPTISPAPSRPN